MTPDPLDQAFADLRARQANRGPLRLPSEELDALLDPQADPAERARVAAAVVADARTRAQFAQLLVVDDELAARVRRRRLRLVTAGWVALAAAILAVVTLWPSAPTPLLGRIVVAQADGPKDPTWPPFLRARRDESLQLELQTGGGAVVHWVAIEVLGPGSWQRAQAPGAALPLADFVPSASAGPLLVACGSEEPAALLATLRSLVDPALQDAARQRGGAGVTARLRAVVGAEPPPLLMGVLELF